MLALARRVALAAVLAAVASAAPLTGAGEWAPAAQLAARATAVTSASAAGVPPAGPAAPLVGSASDPANISAISPAIAPAISAATAHPAAPWTAAAATATRGMIAVADGQASTGTYGAPLIAGCTWATWVTDCQNLTVYGNGSSFTDAGCGTPNGCKFGPEFQCVELAQRYAYYAWGEPANWYGYGQDNGAASTMWSAGPYLPVPLQQFANGTGVPPAQGDLLVFAPGWLGSYWDASGHVAVIRDVGAGYVDIVEENATPSGTDRFVLSGSTVTARGYTPIIGWLRYTEQTALPLPAHGVAGTPQAVSDRPGDIDAVWRGTDSRLYALSYRDNTWSPAPQLISGTGATAASDPSVVSPAPGRVDVLWQGTDGNLWHVQYHSGWYGTGAWSADENLGGAPLASAPHAASPSAGVVDVFWRAADGTLWTDSDSDSGQWSGATPLHTGVLAGDPIPVAVGAGTVDVFWRDASGGLWMASSVPFGWVGGRALGGSFAADPTAVWDRASTVDLVWRAADGTVWQSGFTSGSLTAATRIAAQAMSGRPASAAAESGGAMAVVLKRSDGTLVAAMQTSYGWVGPEVLGEGPAASDPSLVAWNGSAIADLWRDPGGSLWWSSACDGCGFTPPPVFGAAG